MEPVGVGAEQFSRVAADVPMDDDLFPRTLSHSQIWNSSIVCVGYSFGRKSTVLTPERRNKNFTEVYFTYQMAETLKAFCSIAPLLHRTADLEATIARMLPYPPHVYLQTIIRS